MDGDEGCCMCRRICIHPGARPIERDAEGVRNKTIADLVDVLHLKAIRKLWQSNLSSDFSRAFARQMANWYFSGVNLNFISFPVRGIKLRNLSQLTWNLSKARIDLTGCQFQFKLAKHSRWNWKSGVRLRFFTSKKMMTQDVCDRCQHIPKRRRTEVDELEGHWKPCVSVCVFGLKIDPKFVPTPFSREAYKMDNQCASPIHLRKSQRALSLLRVAHLPCSPHWFLPLCTRLHNSEAKRITLQMEQKKNSPSCK